uniref:PQ loop repeat protein n=1 Tax=Heterorhabditis bacteriophora TaxID=37862 RepID=A0A1I7XPE7_HETBA
MKRIYIRGLLILDGDLSAFWAWHDLKSFLITLGLFTTFWSIVTAILIRFTWYVEALGMVSLLVEASLGAPQLIRNMQRKSTQGMSVPMVLAWLCGDLAKTGYFVVTGSPLQFWVCAILQISIDLFILGQVFVYMKNNATTELPKWYLYTMDSCMKSNLSTCVHAIIVCTFLFPFHGGTVAECRCDPQTSYS